MKRVLVITLLILLTACAVTVHAETGSCVMSMTDCVTIQGNVADMTVLYDFDEEVHILLFDVCFPIPLTVESVSVNPAVRDMDGVLVVVDSDEAGQVSVGILCAQGGISGFGELITIRFRFADYYANVFETVDLIEMSV